MRHLRLLLVCMLIAVLTMCAAATVGGESAYSAIARDHVRKSAWGKLSGWTDAAVTSGVPLYDVDGNVVAWGFDVIKSQKILGYVIVNAEIGAPDPVFEFGNGSGLPFEYFKNQALAQVRELGAVVETRYLYPSVLTYAIQIKVSDGQSTGDRFWLRDKGFVTKDDPGLRIPPTDVTASTADMAIMATEEEFVPGLVPDYTWYRGCTPTAAGNILAYWNNNDYPGFPSSRYDLIDELADAMYTDDEGYTYVSDAPGGILEVCMSHGYSDWDSWNDSRGRSYSTYADFQDEILAGRPILAHLMESVEYGGSHSVTGIGYRYDGTSWIIVHDTWDTTETDVYLDYNASRTGDPWWTYVVPGAKP